MSPQLLGTPRDEQSIRHTAEEFVSAWNRHDPKGLAACFAADGDIVNPEGRTGRGKSEVERILHDEQTGLFQSSRIALPEQHLHFLKPDLAIADYRFEVTGVRGADGKETAQKGLMSAVLRRDGDKWLIVAARPMVPTSLLGMHR